MAISTSTPAVRRTAAQVSRASLAVGSLGLACAAFLVTRLLVSWRVTPTASHQVTLLGRRLSYPAANLGAIVILALAALGALVLARAAVETARELAAQRRLQRRLRSCLPAGERGSAGGAFVLDDEVPRAFCAGLLRPRVYCTTGALALLDDTALEAVLAHERHHAQRRDPLRQAAGRVLAGALFTVPGLGGLIDRAGLLAELGADASAVEALGGDRSALARAMVGFDDAARSGRATGIEPARVDHLLGAGSREWQFPVLLFLIAAAAIGVAAAAAALLARVAAGSATLAPPFLSGRPCIVALAAIPVALGAVAVRLRRGTALEPPAG
jgi:Zn-dependent protease with chaperone function